MMILESTFYTQKKFAHYEIVNVGYKFFAWVDKYGSVFRIIERQFLFSYTFR